MIGLQVTALLHQLHIESFEEFRRINQLTPRAGFRGEGRAPGLPATGGFKPNPSIFWLMIDVSLVILREDFEINVN